MYAIRSYYDTLIDFTACEKAALQRAFDQKQIELTKEVYDRYQEINHGLWRAFERGEVTKDTVLMTRFGKLFDALGIEEDGEAFETVYQNLLGQEHVLYEDTIEVLDELKNRYDIYYLTNGVAATQASVITSYSIHYTKLYDIVIIYHMVFIFIWYLFFIWFYYITDHRFVNAAGIFRSTLTLSGNISQCL